MSLYAVALMFPFTGTKGPSPNHEKQPQTVVALRRFHFTITALTVDRGNSSMAEI
jgi:hypothetical protein